MGQTCFFSYSLDLLLAFPVYTSCLIRNLGVSLDSSLLCLLHHLSSASHSLFPLRRRCFSASPCFYSLFALMSYSEIFLLLFLFLPFLLPLCFSLFFSFAHFLHFSLSTFFLICPLCISCSQALLSPHCPDMVMLLLFFL